MSLFIIYYSKTAKFVLYSVELLLEHSGADEIIIVKWIFEKWDWRAWTGLIWLGIRTGSGLLRTR